MQASDSVSFVESKHSLLINALESLKVSSVNGCFKGECHRYKMKMTFLQDLPTYILIGLCEILFIP